MKYYLKDTRVWIFIFLLLLLLISIIAYYNTQLPPSNIAVISQNGLALMVIDLSQVIEEESIVVTGSGAKQYHQFCTRKNPDFGCNLPGSDLRASRMDSGQPLSPRLSA